MEEITVARILAHVLSVKTHTAEAFSSRLVDIESSIPLRLFDPTAGRVLKGVFVVHIYVQSYRSLKHNNYRSLHVIELMVNKIKVQYVY